MKNVLLFLAFIFLLSSISFSASLDSGLVAYYPFNGNANDESGKGNNGIINGANLTTDRFNRTGKAFSFNHSYIEIPNSTSLQSPTTSLTVAFWINVSQWDNNTAGILAKSNTSSLGQYGSVISTTPYIQFDLGGSYVRITRYFGLNTWYFVCLKWNGQRAILYLNGSAYDSTNFSGTLAADSNPLILGKHTPGTARYLIGKLDDVRIYNRALSVNEIQILYDESILDLKVIPEGFYNPSTSRLRMKDTVRVYLRETFSPFRIADSVKAIIDSVSFQGSAVTFVPHGSYYIAVKHRNSVETWSSSPLYFENNVTYDFTTAVSQAYGNNQTLISGKYCIYSGDVIKDGVVDVSDAIDVYNFANIFGSGYIRSDVDGDRFVDVSDIVIVYNNSLDFVSVISPNSYTVPCNLSCNRTFSWSGFNWCVISSNETRCGPGPNFFSPGNDNVYVDSAGDLNLRITKRNGKFYCAEIFTTSYVGYGNYTFYLSSRVDNLDKNVVFGLFTWNDINCVTNANSEIDIEFTKWSDAANPNQLEYSVQPTNGGQEMERTLSSPMTLTGNKSIHFINWLPSSVSFSSYQGSTNPPPPANLISSWVFGNNNPPKSSEVCNSNPIVIPDPQSNTTLDLNLWLDRGSYPSNDQEVQVTIHRIEYTPSLPYNNFADKGKMFNYGISVPNRY